VNKITRIISGIWPESIYQITVNYLTTGESVPRVPPRQRAGPSGTGTMCYTEGIKAQTGRFRSVDLLVWAKFLIRPLSFVMSWA